MAKPTELGDWATSGSADSRKAIAGKRAIGFVNRERATAQVINFLLNVAYQWHAWIDGFFTSGGDFAVPSGKNISVSGAGEFKHGELTLVLSGATAEHYEGGAQQWTYFDSILGPAAYWGSPSGANADVVFPINLKVGDRIKQIKAWVQDDNSAGHTVAMYFHNSVASDMVAGGSQIGATQTSAHDGTVQALTLSGLTTTVAAGNAYEVVLRSGAAGTMKIMSLEVTYDRP